MLIRDFIIGMLVVGIFVGVFTIFITRGAEEAGVTIDDATLSGLQNYTKTDELNDQIDSLSQNLNNTKNLNLGNPIDFANSFIASGWTLLKATFTSFDIFSTISGQAIDATMVDQDTGSGTSYFKAGVYGIFFLFFVFAVISLLVGRDV